MGIPDPIGFETRSKSRYAVDSKAAFLSAAQLTIVAFELLHFQGYCQNKRA